MTNLTVDFVIADAPESAVSEYEKHAVFAAIIAKPAARMAQLGKCSCGSEDYALASELESNMMTGIPASRMYECVNCGTYRLG